MTLEDVRERAGIILGLSWELKALIPADADSRVNSACLRLIAEAQDAALDLEAPPFADIQVEDEDIREILEALRANKENGEWQERRSA